MKNRAVCAIRLPSHSGSVSMGAVGVFAIGSDDAMCFKLWDGAEWHPSQVHWLPLGGVFDSIPAAVARAGQSPSAPRLIDVFAISRDGEPFTARLGLPASPDGAAATRWPPSVQAWRPIGGVFAGALDAADCGGHTLLVGRGADQQPFATAIDASTADASAWLPLTGSLTSEPVIASRSPYAATAAGQSAADACDVFGIGANAEMFHMGLDAGSWPPAVPGWGVAGGVFNGAPAAVRWQRDRIDVFGIGGGNQMFHRALENGAWMSGWEAVGGPFGSIPAAVASASGRLDVFCLGTDRQIHHKYLAGGAWLPSQTDWLPLGGQFISAPTVVSAAIDTIEVLAVGTDGQVYHKSWRGDAGWSPAGLDWQLIGGDVKVPAARPAPKRVQPPNVQQPNVQQPTVQQPGRPAARDVAVPIAPAATGAAEQSPGGLMGAVKSLRSWIRRT